MIETDLQTHIKANVPSINNRVYAQLMPQRCVKPAMVFNVVYDMDLETLGCVVGQNMRFQIDIYSKNYLEVKAIKEELKIALRSFKYKPLELSVKDDYEEETKLHRQIFDFKFTI